MNRFKQIIFLLGCAVLVLGVPAKAQTAAPTYGNTSLATRPRYIIRAGDKVDVVFRYTPDLNQTVTVQPDGYVNLETVGEVKLSGLTVGEATDALVKKSSEHLKDPRITVTLKEFHKPFFVVAGEVQHPGRFDMDQPTTALQALLEAGGTSSAARSSQVLLFRRIDQENDEIRVLDLHKIKSRGDLEHDMMLEPGDMILVPRDRIAKLDRIVRAANTGLFFNPANF